MAIVTTTLVSGQNAFVGSISSRGQYDVSVSSGVQGPAGANGATGNTGANGANGAAGANGVSITNANVVSGNLVLTFSNSSTLNVGTVVGANGTNGTNGTNANTGNITFSNTTMFAGNSKIDFNNPVIGNPTIYVTTTTDDTTTLLMGTDITELRANSYVSIATNTSNTTYTWTFGSDGVLALPGPITGNAVHTIGNTTINGILTATGNTTITGFANASVSVNSSLLTVGTSFVANTTGAYHSGTINAASFTTTGLLANTTALVPTSNTILLGNSIGRFVLSANTGTFSGAVSGITTLAAGNTTITGFANVSTTLQVTGDTTLSANLTVTGNVAGNTAGFAIGYRDIPQNFTNTSFTLALTDAGKHILTQNSGSSTQTITIANNTSVAFPTGAAVTIVVQSAGTVAVANGAGVTMYLAGNSTAKSSVTLNTYSMATLLKIGTNTWIVSGTGAT